MNKSSVDISCSLAGLKMKNPLVLASGVLGTSPGLLARVAGGGAGAVTAKSCGPEPRAGHPNPIALEWAGGIINAVGLTNPGVKDEIPFLRDAKSKLQALGVPLIASIFAPTVDDFGKMAAAISLAEPDFIEVNISCPNVGDDFGTPFSGSAEMTAAVTKIVKENTTIPFSIKLASNVPCIARIAAAAEEAGAYAITAINTVPGMIIDAYAGRPVLSNRVGGISGWSIKPIALRCVAEIYKVVKIPIIGLGGISTGLDAAEMIMAGATAVGVGTVIWKRGPEAFNVINNELCEFMAQEEYPDLESMRGIAIR
jgi:dihydroorotate dehydrogenase (NAD+) catalytic subunit